MTYYKVVTLMCDGDECPEMYDYDRSFATEARENAARCGWVNRGRYDYCPDCAEDEPWITGSEKETSS